MMLKIIGASFKLLLFLYVTFFTFDSYAAAPTCHDYKESGYCKYVGKVKSIYVNSSNIILLYFDTPVDLSQPQEYGFNISNNFAAAIDITKSPEFAKLFYSTALAAQASGRNVSIQMRGVQSGYLKVDRIWLPVLLIKRYIFLWSRHYYLYTQGSSTALPPEHTLFLSLQFEYGLL